MTLDYTPDDFTDPVHVVKVTFGYGRARYSRTVEIHGNSIGYGMLEGAVDVACEDIVLSWPQQENFSPAGELLEELTQEDEPRGILLTENVYKTPTGNPEPRHIFIEDEDEEGEDFLKRLVIGVEIVDLGSGEDGF